MRKWPFDDYKVRKAFGYLLPRKQIIEKLLYNEYEPYDTHHPNTVYANPNNEKVEYNPELANKLLDEAGWTKRNADGIRMKNGRAFIVEAAITKAGIDLQLKMEDWTSTIKNIDARNFTIFPYGYGGLVTPNPETSVSSKLADKTDNNNIQGVKNARIDQLLGEYDLAFDVKRQVEIIREIDGICDSIYYDVHQWNPRGLRVAYWDKFGMPEYVLPRLTQLSYLYQTIAMNWWYEPEKAAAIEEAKKTKKDLGGNKAIQEVKYWKNLQK
jgi:microcin C transport system substrate-binding protein